MHLNSCCHHHHHQCSHQVEYSPVALYLKNGQSLSVGSSSVLIKFFLRWVKGKWGVVPEGLKASHSRSCCTTFFASSLISASVCLPLGVDNPIAESNDFMLSETTPKNSLPTAFVVYWPLNNLYLPVGML